MSPTLSPLRAEPKVSVITVAFNAAATIAATLESVLSQTYESAEYLVIDGGSNDGTAEAIAGYASSIDVFVSEPDRGIYDAMNKGVSLATGDYLLFMNSGDIFANHEALERAVEALHPSENEQVLFGSWIRRSQGLADREVKPALDVGLFNHQAILYSRSIHHRHGPYLDVPGMTTADYFFFASLLARGSIHIQTSDTVIAVVDIGGASAGMQTFSQKHAIDYLFGRIGRMRLAAVLLLHPLYRRTKVWLRLNR